MAPREAHIFVHSIFFRVGHIVCVPAHESHLCTLHSLCAKHTDLR